MNPDQAFYFAFAILLQSTNYQHATVTNVCLFHPVLEMGKWIHVNPGCCFSKKTVAFTKNLCGSFLAQPNHGLIFITTTWPIGLLQPFILLVAIYYIVFSALQLSYRSSFSRQPSADLELIRLLLSQTTLAELLDQYNKIPLGPAWSVQPV